MPARHVLFRKGDFVGYLYLLVDGGIELTIEGQHHVSFSVDKPGEVFGWSAPVEPNRDTAEAVSTKESMVIKISGVHLMEILQKFPSTALTIMKRLAKEISTRPVGKLTLHYEGTR